MCLTLSKTKVFKAKTDIICYKILRKRINAYGVVSFETPFRNVKIDKETLLGKKPFVARKLSYISHIPKMEPVSEQTFTNLLDSAPCIDEGAIHTYRNERHAKSDLEIIPKQCGDCTFVIFKCIIPKDTLYYVGNFGKNICCYASRQLVFKELSVY